MSMLRPTFQGLNFSKRRLLRGLTDVNMASEIFFSTCNKTENLKNPLKFKTVTHVIFDMDGLLLDTETIYKSIITEITESYGKKYTERIRLMALGTTEQATAKIVVKECKLPVTVDQFLEQFRELQSSRLENASLKEGAKEIVTHLHRSNVPIAVATSSGKSSVDVKTKNHRALFDLFHHIVMGSSDPEVKEGKPAPDIFLICADRFDDKPAYEKCLVFEDAPNGVTGARAAGMQAVMIPEIQLPSEETSNATQVLNSLLEFKPEEFGLPPYQKI